MNGKCFDIGTIQAFLDGETAPELTAKITEHIAMCDACAVQLADADEENSIVFSALDREFNSLVPTQRLWTRINDTISVEKSRLSPWQRFMAAFPLLQLSSPTFAAVAGVVMLVTAFGVLNGLRNRAGDDAIAVVQPPASVETAPVLNGSISEPASSGAETAAATVDPSSVRPLATRASVKESRIPAEKIRDVVNATYAAPKHDAVRESNAVQAAYLPGEVSYMKTISDLKQSVDGQKDRVLTPSSRVAYERDMAVVNDSIKRMQVVVRKNPRNQAAKQVLYSAYQDKIDLLNSVTQREELMASLR
ncbi:MAG: zf-HC2 domain-containing protein [Acidobacteriota bacterium]